MSKKQTNLNEYFNLFLFILTVLTVFIIIPFSSERSANNKIRETAVLGDETAKAETAKIKSFSVCLDPGHGAEDFGATNRDISERDINLTVAKTVKSNLENQGYEVYMTREGVSPNLANSERADFCNEKNTGILVSIHHNYYYDSRTDYTMALYGKDTDLPLANIILAKTATALSLTNNGLEKFDDSVLYKSKMPAVLIEGFFLTNSYEYSLLRTNPTARLKEEADAITQGIIEYFSSNQK